VFEVQLLGEERWSDVGEPLEVEVGALADVGVHGSVDRSELRELAVKLTHVIVTRHAQLEGRLYSVSQ
jgi:hypothetical protein